MSYSRSNQEQVIVSNCENIRTTLLSDQVNQLIKSLNKLELLQHLFHKHKLIVPGHRACYLKPALFVYVEGDRIVSADLHFDWLGVFFPEMINDCGYGLWGVAIAHVVVGDEEIGELETPLISLEKKPRPCYI